VPASRTLSNFSNRETEETFNRCANKKYFYLYLFNHLVTFRPRNPCLRMISSNRREAARTTPRGRNKFLSWPGYVACEVVLTFRRPLQALRWFPYVEETGGKIFRSNG